MSLTDNGGELRKILVWISIGCLAGGFVYTGCATASWQ